MGRLGKGGLVQGLQERHRLVIFLAAVLVGHPLAVPAVVVQVQHRGHRIHPQAVDVVFLKPVHRAGHQEALHLGLAVIEDQGAPLLVLPLAGVLILVARGPVEEGQARRVPGEMGGNPVHNDADALLVAAVHKAHKVPGLAIAGGGGKIADDLIAPRTIVRVLGQGHELNVGEAHVLHIGDELVPQLIVGKDAAVLIFPPRARMDLIDIHRLLIMGMLRLVLEPVIIVPVIAAQLHPAGGRAGPGL